jgi:hypothetical protein
VYFTQVTYQKTDGLFTVSMPRRAHCVFHLKDGTEIIGEISDVSMPRRAHCVFHRGVCKLKRSNRIVSMPRRAHCVFHLHKKLTEKSEYTSFNAPKGSLCISPWGKDSVWKLLARFQCPEGLIVYFTESLHTIPQKRVATVSMPRRAHCVFHLDQLTIENLPGNCWEGFNAPKGSLCISPIKTKGENNETKYRFNAPKGSLCISPRIQHVRSCN